MPIPDVSFPAVSNPFLPADNPNPNVVYFNTFLVTSPNPPRDFFANLPAPLIPLSPSPIGLYSNTFPNPFLPSSNPEPSIFPAPDAAFPKFSAPNLDALNISPNGLYSNPFLPSSNPEPNMPAAPDAAFPKFSAPNLDALNISPNGLYSSALPAAPVIPPKNLPSILEDFFLSFLFAKNLLNM